MPVRVQPLVEGFVEGGEGRVDEEGEVRPGGDGEVLVGEGDGGGRDGGGGGSVTDLSSECEGFQVGKG